MEAVLTAAVALLDEAGQSALTFRALASRLGTGVGTIYWYVSNKDELFDRATDHAVGGILTAVEEQPQSDDPIADLREMAIVLFDAMMDRPWLAAYFMRNTDVQDHSLRLYDKLGRQTLRLDLTSRQRFHAVSAIVGVVVGTAADLGAELPQELLDGDVDRVEYLSRYAERWRSLDAAEFPFVHEIADEFAEHDDREQFLAALDLTLAGLRLQAGTRVPEGTTGKPDATANGSPPAS
ncbi:TetR/AcrR family transcriptional regulator [Streptomyces sp. NBC_00663]|uniref:TetR/AcrR family transcriptional regulator n=1 Tax=Streptomyces sp. NBC_00663 TaxID=2975801 RepID=UPI002E304F67|nr:helix-turn-helix domain-containing protein [Streptomyces sp. NBC_00663]